ncbi:MAG: DUF4157 domain-containing protein [Rhizonema sp. PD37]|nr:DUF4157 domain-containing protein [Rhizonema sp. PD37]
MTKEKVQKSFGQSSFKKKHNPIVPPLVDYPTQATSQSSSKVKPSKKIPSLEERDAIRRSLFEKWGNATPSSIVDVRTHIQAKLTIGAPGDKYEQEADRVASQVVNLLNAPVAQQSDKDLQREEVSTEDDLKMKSEVNTIQLHEIIEEEEELQMKPMVQLQSSAGGMTATPEVETSIQQARGGGQSLADNIREPMEQAFGADFSGVKVHTDAQADLLNQSIQAYAFTTGQDVFFRSGEYQPGSPGGQELIAHELTHVVQQSGGAVRRAPLPPQQLPQHPATEAPSASVGDGVIQAKDDVGLEAEADDMGAWVLATPPIVSAVSLQAPDQHKVVQAKGEQKLHAQLTAEDVANWKQSLEKTDPQFKEVMVKMQAYDDSTDARPSCQSEEIRAMIELWEEWTKKEPASDDLNKKCRDIVENVLLTEMRTTQMQFMNLVSFTNGDEGPYEQMTEEGLLWSHPDFAQNKQNIGKTGLSYFQALSAMNLESMNGEARNRHFKPLSSMEKLWTSKEKIEEREKPDNYLPEWFKQFIQRAKDQLNKVVLTHYTTAERAQIMLKNGGLKSKTVLKRDLAVFKDNSSAYDDQALANTGFLFFFIETADASARATRFGTDNGNEVDAARISIPIKRSGLLERGWIMLSDFAQREYPDIQTNAKSDTVRSWLHTRSEELNKPENVAFTKPVRHFQQGMGQMNGDSDMTEWVGVKGMVKGQAMGDPQSQQTYVGPKGKQQFSDKIFNNVLVGKDIIDGLTIRAALEVDRIAIVNPKLGETLKRLEGNALMRFMLKDLMRPQAMIPNTLKINEDDITVIKKKPPEPSKSKDETHSSDVY